MDAQLMPGRLMPGRQNWDAIDAVRNVLESKFGTEWTIARVMREEPGLWAAARELIWSGDDPHFIGHLLADDLERAVS